MRIEAGYIHSWASAHALSFGRSKRRRPNKFDQQVAFFAALFACLAKIAKADGRVDVAEIQKIEEHQNLFH